MDVDNNDLEETNSKLRETKDEIINEIKILHDELDVVEDKCKQAQQELLINAKRIIGQQQIRNKIDQIDIEVLFN